MTNVPFRTPGMDNGWWTCSQCGTIVSYGCSHSCAPVKLNPSISSVKLDTSVQQQAALERIASALERLAAACTKLAERDV